jgi:two-component system sensor kinase FixL
MTSNPSDENAKAHESSLEGKGSVFPLIIEHAPVGILLVDKSGKIVLANPKAENILGYEKGELLEKMMELLLPESARSRHASFMADPKPRPMGTGRHLQALHKRGHEISVEIGLAAIETLEGTAVLASIVDISAAKEAANSIAQLAAIVEASEEAIITLGPMGEILTWNRGAERLYGYSAGEMLGKNISPVVPPERSEEFRVIREKLSRGESVQQLETVRLRKDGQRLSVLLALSPLFNEDGSFRGAATITHDITERKHLEQDFLFAVEMEQKRIAQDLHDSLGQQLLAVSFLCNILKKKLTAESRQEASEAARIEDLMNEAKLNLRQLTRGLYAADLEALGLGNCLKSLAEQMQEMSGIPCTFSGDAAVTVADRSISENLYRLAQEALNNAVKYSQAKNITITLRKDGPRITLAIMDSGIGLPPSASRHSTGMGLRTMRYRAHIMGGSFEIGLRPEGGTIVSCSVLTP